jgi:D-alanyl-lipoteichoic acid acyltransferase DltB (MBOAT superfamily)
MSFEEPGFVLLFVATYAAWLLLRYREVATVWLLCLASLTFYGAKHWRLLPLLLGYCVANWLVALWIERSRRPGLALGVGVGLNLGALSFYKYTPMLYLTFAPWIGWPEGSSWLDGWAIPFGISFYAFTGIAYMADVYRKVHPAEPSLLRYTLSAAFFPHLVAGPILRPHEFLYSLAPGRLPTAPQSPGEACWLIARGYFKKMVLANRIGLAIDPFFAHVAGPATEGVWSLPFVWMYALQIYLDFSAYTDLARGFGLLFGYRWPDNFNAPYLAASVADFWHRWHITLSRFLRDYLYIPLGGSRLGWLRTNVNLMATMLLGGLWHGASWSFLLWGGLHGAFLVIHRAWASTRLAGWLGNAAPGPVRAAWHAFSVLLTFHCVCLAWCFFRLTRLSESLVCVRKWLVFDADKMLSPAVFDPSLLACLSLYAAASLAVSRAAPLGGERREGFVAGLAWGVKVALVVLAICLAPGRQSAPFIYFQF